MRLMQVGLCLFGAKSVTSFGGGGEKPHVC